MKNVLMTVLLPIIILNAQPGRHDDDKESRKAMGIWQLTEKLDLTEKQAEKFFPKFNAHQNEMDELGKARRLFLKDIYETLKEDKDVSEKTLDKAIKDLEDIEEKKIKARIDFLKDLDGVLTTKQRAKLLLAPDKMRREAKDKIKKHKKSKERRHKRDRW